MPIEKLPVKQKVPVKVAPKPLVKSKMAWWDLVITILQIVDYFALGGYIPQPYGAIAHGVVSMFLRYYTGEPISGIFKVKEYEFEDPA